jgi:hypothetical protein
MNIFYARIKWRLGNYRVDSALARVSNPGVNKMILINSDANCLQLLTSASRTAPILMELKNSLHRKLMCARNPPTSRRSCRSLLHPRPDIRSPPRGWRSPKKKKYSVAIATNCVDRGDITRLQEI